MLKPERRQGRRGSYWLFRCGACGVVCLTVFQRSGDLVHTLRRSRAASPVTVRGELFCWGCADLRLKTDLSGVAFTSDISEGGIF